ncbi:MAG: mechanosensitive ion channel family protein [Acidilobus sp.]
MARTNYLGAIAISGIAVGITLLVGYFLTKEKVIPASYENYFYGVLWVVAAIIVTHAISSRVKASLTPHIGPANASSVAFVVKLAGYTITFVGFLAFIRVSVSEALAAGGFLGLVVGLASQYVLSNILAGIMIIITRPYKVGDRITFTTWQYGLLAPTYPPKFFSQDFLIPGYTGTVVEITLMYTIIMTDENVPLKVPNSVMAQAAIFTHSDAELRKVRTKYEIPKDVDPELVTKRVKEEVSKLPFIVGEPIVNILDTSQSTYVIAVDVYSRGFTEEPVRSEVIKVLMRVIEELRARRSSQEGRR